MILYPNFYKNKFKMIRSILLRKNSSCLLEDPMLVFIIINHLGKSSLINTIFNDTSIARKAKHPGTTKFLHFH